MKVPVSEFAKKLSMLKGLIPSKSDIESLQGVLISKSELTVYDLEMALRVPFPEAEDTSLLLPPKAIETIMSLPHDGTVEITANDTQTVVTISCGSIKSRLSTLSPATYPELPAISNSSESTIDGQTLTDALGDVFYAAATANESKPVQTGILLEADGEKLNLVTCDGYRVAWQQLPYKESFKMVVPRNSAAKIIQLGLTGEAKIIFDKKFAIFQTEGYTLHTRLLQGEFINYRGAFPGHTNKVKVNRSDIAKAVSRATICMDGKIKPPLVVDIAEGVMGISMASSLGTYTEDIMLSKVEDESVKIGFNPRYLADCMKSYSTDEVELSFGGTVSPMVVTAGDFRSIVLPVKLKRDGAI